MSYFSPGVSASLLLPTHWPELVTWLHGLAAGLEE